MQMHWKHTCPPCSKAYAQLFCHSHMHKCDQLSRSRQGDTIQVPANQQLAALCCCSGPAFPQHRLLLHGQVYYQLSRARQARRIRDVVLVRLEQIAPFPHDLVARVRSRCPLMNRRSFRLSQSSRTDCTHASSKPAGSDWAELGKAISSPSRTCVEGLCCSGGPWQQSSCSLSPSGAQILLLCMNGDRLPVNAAVVQSEGGCYKLFTTFFVKLACARRRA